MNTARVHLPDIQSFLENTYTSSDSLPKENSTLQSDVSRVHKERA